MKMEVMVVRGSESVRVEESDSETEVGDDEEWMKDDGSKGENARAQCERILEEVDDDLALGMIRELKGSRWYEQNEQRARSALRVARAMMERPWGVGRRQRRVLPTEVERWRYWPKDRWGRRVRVVEGVRRS